LLEELLAYKEWQEANKAEYKELYFRHYIKNELSETGREVQRIIQMQQMDFEIPLNQTLPVFVKENGEFKGTDSTHYASKIINHELGIKFNFHAFRHTHATMLIESGVLIKAVSDRLGHGNVRTTLETYVHTTNNMKSDAVDKFEQFGSLNGNKIVNIREAKKELDKEIAR
jgi:integrase